ncbi:APC family permease [Anaerovorax odorimutans]|uniref:APC family permease n=1 Tax=Anaerovorax odorimutans TaxID=109327 RepID=UPI00040EA3CE|nr:APC family permease [Anaerovorax odorimutans]
MKEENIQRESLSKVLCRRDVLALAFGTMVGWGWVMLTAGWVSSAGVLGAIVAFLIAAVLCLFVGATYAELTPALPLAGGELVFAYRGLGFFWSWFTAWAICLAYIGVAAWEGIAISTAINYIIPFPQAIPLWTINGSTVYLTWSIVGIIGAAILMIINIIGIKQSAIFQTVGTVGIVLSGIVFITGGSIFGSGSNLDPLFTGIAEGIGPWAGIIAVMLMAPSMFVGFDVIPQSAEEMNIPHKQIAGVVFTSILMGAAWYILMILAASLSAPESVRESFSESVPVAEITAYAFGSPVWGKIMIIGALCGIITSWNGFFIGASRVIFSMGRAKMLPAIFGKVNAKHQTPTAAVVLTGIICMVSPLLGRNALVWFVDTASFGTVIAYLMVSISFIAIRRKEPELNRPYNNKYPKVVGFCAVVVALFFICLYLPFGPGSLVWPYEWMFVLFWIILGVILAIAAKASIGPVSKAEREYLIFGKEYARKDIIKDLNEG